eukprot:GILI01005522.1.p1 GENE.GILI01005522.1~~GILI01005522.1.p1  ORF type:complete len:765 (+),score=160.12 GILI01005522.1:49-2343(+)
MGCNQSSEKKPQPPSPDNGTNGSNEPTGVVGDSTTSPTTKKNQKSKPPPLERTATSDSPKPDYKSLRLVVADAEEVLKCMSIDPEEKKLVALSFINTLADVLRNSYRLKKDAVTEAVEELCNDPKIVIHRSVIPLATQGAREEFISHLISSWIAKNPSGEPTLPSELANEVLVENQITPWKTVPMRFGDCYKELLRIGDSDYTNAVFHKYSDGNLTMTAQQFLTFLLECQHSDAATLKTAEEKTKERFGAVGTRFTFALYLQSLTLNTARDPRCGGTVWQDMTQPLPQYMVRTTVVDNEEELECSLALGARAVVLRCREENQVVMAGTATLDRMLHIIKEEGFAKSTYPLMLCLAPELVLSVALQDKIAKTLHTILGDELLAKGMMFSGATINDPQFSPAALQRRVLVVSSQAPLKPYVGFNVADMNRTGLGVKVTSVVAHTPAAKAGVVRGDWFTHINNEQIQDKSHLKSVLAKLQLGEEFTMRRENLDDVTIVTGGTVEGDEVNSKELSNIVFLKFTPEAKDNSPWDICWIDSEVGFRETQGITPEAIAACEVRREQLTNHFTYTELPKSSPETITSATHAGVQLICASRSTIDQKWSRGFFSDNGDCGYVQKSHVDCLMNGFRIQLKCPPPHYYNWTIAGVRATIYGVGEVKVDEEKFCIEVTGADTLSVFTFQVTLMPPIVAANGETSVRYMPALPTSPNKAMAESIAKPIVLSGSLPLSILRLGIRSCSSVEEKDEGKIRTMPTLPILAEITSIHPVAQ